MAVRLCLQLPLISRNLIAPVAVRLCAEISPSPVVFSAQALVAAQGQKEQELQERYKALAEEREDLRRALQAVPAQ